MLKLQVGSKIAALFPDSDWKKAEDLLTADFFGALDYLPRSTYCQDFLMKLIVGKSRIEVPMDDVEWDNVEFRFWPRLNCDREITEPDVLLVSNRWVIVIEAKLEAGWSGKGQPRREYRVGCDVATQQNVPQDHVFYLLVSKHALDIRATFSDEPPASRQLLIDHSISVRWSDIYRTVQEWLYTGVCGKPNAGQCVRLLEDVCKALRLRPALTFSNFRLPSNAPVGPPPSRYFAPPAFSGFVHARQESIAIDVFMLSTKWFRGFLNGAPAVAGVGLYLAAQKFGGFLVDVDHCPEAHGGFGLPDWTRATSFQGFFFRVNHRVPACDDFGLPKRLETRHAEHR